MMEFIIGTNQDYVVLDFQKEIKKMLTSVGLSVTDSQTKPYGNKGFTMMFPIKDKSKFRGFKELKAGEFQEQDQTFSSWLLIN